MAYSHATAILEILAQEAIRQSLETSILEERLEKADIAQGYLRQYKRSLKRELKHADIELLPQ